MLPLDALTTWLTAPKGTVAQTVPTVDLDQTSLTSSLEALGSRSSSYARPPVARYLPTRWIVYGTTPGLPPLAFEITRPTNEDLPVGPRGDPSVSASTPGAAMVDPAMLWMIDFEAAERAAWRHACRSRRIKPGSGSPASTSPASTTTRGLRAFSKPCSPPIASRMVGRLSRRGRPRRALRPRRLGTQPKPNFAASFAAERQLGKTFAMHTTDSVSRRVGIAVSAVQQLPGTFGSNKYDADCMALALWDVAIGYHPSSLVQYGGATSALANEIHDRFLGTVRGHGPYPRCELPTCPMGFGRSRRSVNSFRPTSRSRTR